jgi:predicted nuclease of predicted toxin-antitoxin system
VKLLLDENLSDRLIPQILDLYPDSTHVKSHNLTHSEDGRVWEFAKTNDYVIVSKDADFHQMSLVFGHPPKVVFLRVGNCATSRILQVLRANRDLLNAFGSDEKSSVLVLD